MSRGQIARAIALREEVNVDGVLFVTVRNASTDYPCSSESCPLDRQGTIRDGETRVRVVWIAELHRDPENFHLDCFRSEFVE